QAHASFVRLDVADNPAGYVAVQPLLTQNGRLPARLQNPAPVALDYISVEFRAEVDGRVESNTVVVRSMDAGEGGALESAIAVPQGVVPASNQVSVRVVGAGARLFCVDLPSHRPKRLLCNPRPLCNRRSA